MSWYYSTLQEQSLYYTPYAEGPGVFSTLQPPKAIPSAPILTHNILTAQAWLKLQTIEEKHVSFILKYIPIVQCQREKKGTTCLPLPASCLQVPLSPAEWSMIDYTREKKHHCNLCHLFH